MATMASTSGQARLKRNKSFRVLSLADFRDVPPAVKTLLEKLADEHQSAMGKVQMCFDSPNFSIFLDISQVYTISTQAYMSNKVRMYKTTLSYEQNGHALSLNSISNIKQASINSVAENWVSEAIVYLEHKYELEAIDPQMDSTEETHLGTSSAEGTLKVNTIMVDATTVQETEDPRIPKGLTMHFCSGQYHAKFPILQNRDVPLISGTFNTTDTPRSHKLRLRFPQDFYEMEATPMTRPDEQFIFQMSDVQITVKTNATKFTSGLYMVAALYDPAQIYARGNPLPAAETTSFNAAWLRNHTLINLGSSNTAHHVSPYNSKAPFITTRNNETTTLVGGVNLEVIIWCIVPMRTGDSTALQTPFTVYVARKGTTYIGMRYAVSPATSFVANGGGYSTFLDTTKSLMAGVKTVPVIGGLVGGVSNALGHLAIGIQKPFRKPEQIQAIEKQLKYIGIVNNRDKPTILDAPMEVRPNVTGNLSVGTNIAHHVLTMQLDQSATGIVLEDHGRSEITDVHQLISDWSYVATFTWTIENTAGTELYSNNVMPGWDKSTSASVRTQTSMLDAVAQYYTYYTGDVEYQLIIVGTGFHTGVLVMGYIPYHDTFTSDDLRSGYWKICEVREQQEFEFLAPYVNNTVCRLLRDTTPLLNTGEAVPSPGSFKVFVINPLNPIDGASNTVEVVVCKRAAPNLRFSYPKPILGTGLNSGGLGGLQYGLPVTMLDAQLDMGEDDSIDNTPVHHSLLPGGLHVQTNENHMDIKTLLRRPTLMVETTFPGGQYSALPIVPMNATPYRRERTIQQFLMKQFRYYRGGLIYHFNLRDTEQNRTVNPSTRVLFYHIPQGNACFFGQLPTSAWSQSFLRSFLGQASQIWYPHFNPTCLIAIPFHGVYDKLDLHVSHTTIQGRPWADRMAGNLGMLIIFSENGNLDVEILTQISDDGTLLDPTFAPTLNNQLSQTTNTLTNELMDVSSPLVVERTPPLPEIDPQDPEEEEVVEDQTPPEPQPGINDPAMAQYTTDTVDVLPTPPALSGFCGRVRQRITNSMTHALQPLSNSYGTIRRLPQIEKTLTTAADSITSAMEYVKEAAHRITDGIKKSFSWVTNIGAVFSSILHFLQCIINPVWETIVVAIVGVLVSIGCFATSFGSKLMDFFLKLKPQTSQNHRAEGLVVDPQCEHDDCTTCGHSCHPNCNKCSKKSFFSAGELAALVALVFGSISATLGYKGEAPDASMFKKMFNFTKNFWLTVYQSGHFLTAMINMVKKCFNWIGKRMHIGTTTLTNDNQAVQNFISEATKMIDERNATVLESSPAMKYRFWYTVAAAHQMVAKFTGTRLPEAASILRLAFKVIEKGNSVAIQAMACPVRYEPFVLALEGPSNIGKSYMLQQMLPKLMGSDSYNIRTYSSPVYVRTPGVEFWNGYTSQPCILYDDFLAVRSPEIAVRQVAELYNLKSTAQFNLNMASLEEKKMLGNPFMVALACNNAFTTINGTVDPKAFLRRKEHCWRVQLKPEYQTIHQVPDEVKARNGMYEFRRYTDPSDSKSLSEEVLTYDEWYDKIQQATREYHLKEQANVRLRLDGLKTLLPTTARSMMHEVDPFRIFYSAYIGAVDRPGLTQGGLLPSELLDLQIESLANLPDTPATVINTAPIAYIVNGRPNNQLEHEIVDQASYYRQRNPCPLHTDEHCNCLVPISSLGDIRPQIIGATYSWMKSWLKSILYTESPDNEAYRLHPENFSRVAQCPVCLNEVLCTYRCENMHYFCHHCWDGIRIAHRENIEMPLNCPTCRSDTVVEVDIAPPASGDILRMILWKRKLFSKAKITYYEYREFVTETMRKYPGIRYALTLLLITGYISGVSLIIAHSHIRDEQFKDHLQNMWCEDDDYHRTSTIKRWGILWYIDTDYLKRRDHRDVYTQDPYQTDYYDIPMYGQAPEDDEFAEARSGPEWLIGDMDPELVQYIDTQVEVKITTSPRCPHMRLLSVPRNVYYGTDFLGDYYWEIGMAGNDRIYDQPCQYDNCVWKDRQTRFQFLNTWAPLHRMEIQNMKREWERTGGSFPLPPEFAPAALNEQTNPQQEQLTTLVESFKGKNWWDYVKGACQMLGRAIMVGASIAAGIGLLMKSYQLFTWLRPGTAETINTTVGNIVNSGSAITRRLARQTYLPRIANAVPNSDQDVEERAIRAIEKNTVFIVMYYTRPDGTSCIKRMRCLGLFGRTFCMPGHYGKYMMAKQKQAREKKYANFKFQIERFVERAATVDFPITEQDIRYTQNDLAYMVAPSSFNMFKDITNYIPTLAQHADISPDFLYVECEANQQMLTTRPSKISGIVDTQRVRGTDLYPDYEIFDGYVTDYGRRGACGAICVSRNNAPLFAMHVAGQNGEGSAVTALGVAIPLIREDIEDLKRGEMVLSYWVPNIGEPADARMSLDGAILPIGSVKKNQVAFMPKKTKIIPSMLQGKLEMDGEKVPLLTEPGILSSSDPRYQFDGTPLYHGCMKHTNPPKQFDDKILEYCVEQISNEVNSKVTPTRNILRKLTLEESIHGFNDLEYYDCIDLQTSAGWPWNTATRKTKGEYIKITRDKHSNITSCEVDKDLLDDLKLKDQMRERGIRPFTVFLDWLKDERRKHSKLELKDGTRIFSLSPVDLTIQTRQQFLDFSAAFMTNREKLEHAVGIIVDGPEWSRLANGLLNHSHVIVTGDYSDFGPRLASQVVRAAFQIMINWYLHNGADDEADIRRKYVIAEEHANANHIMHDFIYQGMCGSPSGSAMTVIVNSLCNMLYIRYAWMKLFPASNEKEFKEKVHLKVYGDDLIMAVKEDVKEEFNCQTISKVFSEYDIKFTDANKTGTEKYTTIDKATFLKSAFVRHPVHDLHWLSALDQQSITECAQWVWKSRDHSSATLENAEQSIRLAYGHGPAFFKKWKKVVNKALTGLHMTNVSLTWDHIDQQFFKIESCQGTFVKCSHFDDGLGLNAFASFSTKRSEDRRPFVDLLAGASGEEALLA